MQLSKVIRKGSEGEKERGMRVTRKKMKMGERVQRERKNRNRQIDRKGRDREKS